MTDQIKKGAGLRDSSESDHRIRRSRTPTKESLNGPDAGDLVTVGRVARHVNDVGSAMPALENADWHVAFDIQWGRVGS